MVGYQCSTVLRILPYHYSLMFLTPLGLSKKSSCFISAVRQLPPTILLDLEGHSLTSFLQHCHGFIESDVITALTINSNDDITSLNESRPVSQTHNSFTHNRGGSYNIHMCAYQSVAEKSQGVFDISNDHVFVFAQLKDGWEYRSYIGGI